jgi:hypothetical protein
VVGQIGLQTANVAGAGGAGGLIVNLQGVLDLAASVFPAAVVLRDARSSANQFVLSTLTLPQWVHIQEADVTAPAAAELVYRLLVDGEPIADGVSLVRTGPQAFSGIAMDGDYLRCNRRMHHATNRLYGFFYFVPD